jgi:hypothetical protein
MKLRVEIDTDKLDQDGDIRVELSHALDDLASSILDTPIELMKQGAYWTVREGNGNDCGEAKLVVAP